MDARLVKRMVEAYGQGSESYASVLDPTLRPMAEEILRIGDVRGGGSVMDLATGTGSVVGRAALSGRLVVGVDLSPGMLVTARRLWADHGSFVAADAIALPFARESFDVVTAGLCLTHFPDVFAALCEVRRVLRPGGRFVGSSWGRSGRDSSAGAAIMVLGKYLGLADPFEDLLDEGTWASRDRGCEVLEGVGFASVGVTTLPLSGTYRSPAAALEWTFAWPLIGEGLDELDPARLAALQVEAIAAIEEANDLTWQYGINYFEATEPGKAGATPLQVGSSGAVEPL